MEQDFGTQDIITGRGLGIGGFGYGYGQSLQMGNSVLAASAHADGTALKEAMNCNSVRVSDGFATLATSFDNQTRQAQFSAVEKAVVDTELRNADRFTAINKSLSDVEFRSLDRQRDIERLMVEGQKESAKCCCETQKLITAEATATRAVILEVEGRANVAQLAVAQAKITQLETINALQSNGHHRAA